jgi:alpha-N-acetylglucosamine transferase
MKFLPGWDLQHIDQPNIRSGEDYNKILTDTRFWEMLPYDRVLIFQHDSMLLREGIDEFLQYDFIGAPIKNFPFPAMNGGLSLRSPQAMIEAIVKKPRQHTKYAHHNEDIYYSYICNELGMNLPDYETARKFSVETIFGLGSLGIHAIDKHLKICEQQKILTQYGQA